MLFEKKIMYIVTMGKCCYGLEMYEEEKRFTLVKRFREARLAYEGGREEG